MDNPYMADMITLGHGKLENKTGVAEPGGALFTKVIYSEYEFYDAYISCGLSSHHFFAPSSAPVKTHKPTMFGSY